mmetsp:Transcript_31888/g.67039  ORF Transcript_31888/g.67039 Transcript_31888/m.67039 type:complete len:282 (+) Transcript_31888:202-1047(+)|eukprot:CAMPEP_0172308396 /NCGR_PEP_ID=MMETSP1058-20130122/8999_1 /TAXON_ID=83371 /ORGANISM="Detonula confervacea, Strain CCMP 353" /LENGTH=281 /DNA_ID=CAMNT_0013020793 /DNA_START=159 /DNA_END=1004 /DNA_ORIENTATION=-
MQQHNNNSNSGAGHDLEFSTTIDGSVQQNVPIPPPQTNSVLSGMISSAAPSSSSTSSPQSSYTPSALPAALQFSKSSHPTACLFHILFKGLAFTLYILGSKMMEDIMVTVLCIILLAADFWVVKNITGRLLVGLRWWNKVDPVSGNTSWVFESADPSGKLSTTTNNFDSKFFWFILYITPVLWGVLTLSAVLFLRFNCFVTLTCALILAGSNVYGYYKCSTDQRERLNAWMNTGAQFGVSAMMRNPGIFGWLGSRLSGGGGGGARQQVPQQDPSTMQGTFA